MTGADVCLVQMPVASVTRPSLGLSLLRAILERDGIRAEVRYPNLWFVEYAGLRTWELLHRARIEDGLGDWLFAGVAFPDFAPDHEAYLERIHRLRPGLRKGSQEGSPGLRQELLAMREEAGRFVDFAAREILSRRPRIVGCSSMFQQHVASLALLRRIRELAPDVVTLLGGPNCETVMGRATHEHFPWVDFVVSGEADDLVTPLCRGILGSGRDLAPGTLPPAILTPADRAAGYAAGPGRDGRARATTARLDALPLPDHSDFFERELPAFLHRGDVRPGLPYESSRGCWWGERSHCTFCGLNGGGMAFRSKPADQAAREIGELVSRYGVTRVQTVDNIIDLSYFESLLPLLEDREPALSVFYETKANLTREQVAAFARAGVRWIQPGIESLHTGALRLMRKGVSAWQNVRLLKWCRQFGVRPMWNVILGLPGERDAWHDEVADLLPWLEHLVPGHCGSLRFDRYSPYFDDPARWGVTLEPAPPYAAIYPLGPAALADQAWFFQRRGDGGAGAPAEGPGARRLRAAMAVWVARWSEPGPPPLLEVVPDSDGLLVRDERSTAGRRQHRLAPEERDVLVACEDGPGLRALAARLPHLGGSRLDRLLDALAARGLVLALDGHRLSLVLHAPRPLAPLETYPAGTFRPRARGIPLRPAA